VKRLLALVLVAGIAIVVACSNQGEGEVCNIENDSDDCEQGLNLVCYPAGQLNNVTSDRCCPSDRARATHPACVTAVAIVGIADAQPPADTGPAPTPPASDSGTVADAGAEAAPGQP